MTVRLLTWDERPDLADRGPAPQDVWPEYNRHGDVFARIPPGEALVTVQEGVRALRLEPCLEDVGRPVVGLRRRRR